MGTRIQARLVGAKFFRSMSWKLFNVGRPATGIYAFLLTLISFSFDDGASWYVRLVTAACFAGITMSIMAFNDWTDRYHDRKKGKTFVSENEAAVIRYWLRLAAVTAALLLMVVSSSLALGALCSLVWAVGLAYSFVPHWFVTQNVMVALCSGSPALCGMAYHQQYSKAAVATFLILVFLVLWNEVLKDIEDAGIDLGYKETFPLRIGHVRSVAMLIGFQSMLAMMFLFHPNEWVVSVGIVSMPLLAFQLAYLLLHPERVKRPKFIIQHTITALLTVLLFT